LFLVKRRRSIEHKSHKPVKKFNGSIELLESLSPVALKILGVLGADGVASEAAKIAGCTKSNVTYWKNRFLRAGALRLQSGGFVKYYRLTPYGSKLLTGSEGVLRLPVVLEDHPVKFGIVEHEKSCIDWRKLGSPRNWVKLGVRIGEVRVVKTSQSIIVHPGQLKGFNVDALEVDAGRIVERVRYILEVRFGMVLSDEAVPLHDPHWQVYRPECKEWVEAGTVEVKGVGRLDHSPPSRKPHLEYDRKHLAEIAVNFPVILENLDGKIDFLTENICRLVDSVGKLSDALGKIFNLESSQENVPKLGVPSYVS
jgi:hypothetical protein